MGNSQVQLDWNLVRLAERSSVLSEEESSHFTSPTTFKTFTTVRVLDAAGGFFLAKDDDGTLYHLHLYQMEDFEAVRELLSKLQFLRDNQVQLCSATIIDILEEPNSDVSWTIVVITEFTEFVTLEAWMEYGNSISTGTESYFALDDVIQGLIKILEVVEFAHRRDQWLGQLLPHNVQICKLMDGSEAVFSVRFDLLHCQCFADLSETKMSILNPPEGVHHTFKRDVWDLGITLLTVMEYRKVIKEVTRDSIKNSPLPASIRHLLLLMFREEEQRPDAHSILSDPTLVLLKLILKDEEVETVKVNHIPALCLGLKLRTLSRKMRCLKWLLHLVTTKTEAEIRDQEMIVDWSDLVATIGMMNLVEDVESLGAIFLLAMRMLKLGACSAIVKQSGFVRFAINSLSILPPDDPRMESFFPLLLQFAAKSGSTALVYEIYNSALFHQLKEEGSQDLKAFFCEVGPRLGLCALECIQKLSEKLQLSHTETFQVIEQVSLHSFYLMPGHIQVSDFLRKFIHEKTAQYHSKVTTFLEATMLNYKESMSNAFQGKCLSLKPSGSQMTCELGYSCETCRLGVCQSCLKRHLSHKVSFCGRVKCNSSHRELITPTFLHLKRNILRNFPCVNEFLGPGRFELPIASQGLRSCENEEILKLYVEFLIQTAGESDNFQLGVVSHSSEILSYTSQVGEIRAAGHLWPGPLMGCGDVVGVGLTSWYRVFITFNGMMHPAVASAENLEGSSLVLQLDPRGKVVVNTKRLFDLRFCVNLEEEAAVNSSMRLFSEQFFSEYEKATGEVNPKAQKGSAQSFSSSLKRTIRSAQSSVPDPSRCKCSLF